MRAYHIEAIRTARGPNGISRKAKRWNTMGRLRDIRYLLEVGYLWVDGDKLRATRKGVEAMFEEDDSMPSRFSAHRSWWEAL